MDESLQRLSPPGTFIEAIEAAGIAFDDGDMQRLGLYLALLLDANTRFNLTSVTDPGEAWMRHIFDSLTLLPYIVSSQARRIIDVGSGGGLPGVPLAITLPDVQFTLLEATGKKARFLQQAADAIELSNVAIVNERAETAGRDREHHRERYDIVTARALGKLPTMLELTVPLAKVGGHILAIKGEQALREIETSKEALDRLHAQVIDSHRTQTGTIVVIEKHRSTSKLYPRRPGEPKRAPIGARTGDADIAHEAGDQ